MRSIVVGGLIVSGAFAHPGMPWPATVTPAIMTLGLLFFIERNRHKETIAVVNKAQTARLDSTRAIAVLRDRCSCRSQFDDRRQPKRGRLLGSSSWLHGRKIPSPHCPHCAEGPPAAES